MSSNREVSSVTTTRRPLDLAIAAAIEGDHETALRHAAATIEAEPSRAMAVLVAGRVLAAMGHVEPSATALRKAVELGVSEGSLPRAMAAVVEMRKLGVDTGDTVAKLARLFARGSARLTAPPAAPPALRKVAAGLEPPVPLSGEALVARVTSLVAGSPLAGTLDDPASLVPPQVLLSLFDEDGLRRILEMLDVVWVVAGTSVVEQGHTGLEAYLLARGEVEVRRTQEGGGEVALARLGSGALFGEMALLARATRAASVVACRPSILLVARKDDLDNVVASTPDVGEVLADYCRRRMMGNLVRTSAILKCVESAERAHLIQRFVTCSFEKGKKLIRQGQAAEGLHLIASGEVAVIRHEGDERTVLATLTVGEVVGEMSLVLRRPSSANVVATAPTVTLHLPHGEFMGIVRRYPGVLQHLYELAVERDDLTTSIVAQEASNADEFVLL